MQQVAASSTQRVTVLPQALQTAEMPGWLDRRLVRLFREYAEFCFLHYGTKVARWSHRLQPGARGCSPVLEAAARC